MKTEEMLSSAGETFEFARAYVEQQRDYIRLETSKRLAKTTSNLATLLIIAILGFMVFLFFCIAVGLLLGNLWGSYAMAFFFVTGVIALTTFLIYFFKDKIITNPIVALIVRDLLD